MGKQVMRAAAALVALVLMMWPAAIGAIEQRPMPAFRVVTSDGAPVDSAQLSSEVQFLVVYVGANCRPCDAMLESLKGWASPALIARTVVIVRGGAPAATDYMQRQLPQELQGIKWYADPDNAAAKALKLQGAPVIIGVKTGVITWSISGVLSDPPALQSVVRSWVEY